MKEVWKWVKDYEKLYQVSNLGRVRKANGVIKAQWGTLKPGQMYKSVSLCKNGVERNWYVHRLVAIHFIKNPHNYPYVLHKENDRSNNTAKNLKWGTQAHNIADAIRQGTFKTGRKNRTFDKLDPDKVREIRRIARDEKVTPLAIAARFGVGRTAIVYVLNGKNWKHVK